MTLTLSRQPWLRACGWLAAGCLAATALVAQSTLPARINAEIADSQPVALPGSLHPLAQAQFDAGRMSPDTAIQGVTIVFNRSQAQEADLQALIAAQQNPSSPLYHQWLTPDQFAARFGMAQADLDKVEGWLAQHGFVVDSVARSRNFIRFSGTVGEIESAFSTQMHYYKEGGVQHFAPSTALSLPSALAPIVLVVRNLDDFRPQPHVIFSKSRPRPAFTSGDTDDVYFAPGDIATIYNIKPLYSAGDTGTGQSIAIIGQSAVQLSDLQNFQNAAGLAVNNPTMALMPGTGASTVFADGDEGESDLDLEWSDAIAPGANIIFVYTGSDENYGAFDSIEYAIDEQLAPIVSSSYGLCEAALGGETLESTFEQATAQGQTVVASAGDDGSTDCSGITGLTTAQQEALAVDYPASSAYVTGVGGTEIPSSTAAYLTPGEGYWQQTTEGTDLINSALQYIPETAWNDDTPQYGLSAGGGGASILFSKPAWQAGVAGIPSDGKRDVPDIALYASPEYPGYLICTSDETAWGEGQVASCNSGFRDGETEALTAAGGTSFGPPIFSGIVALISQKANYTTGQGLINPTLYTLAANNTTYAAAFHDITTGTNDCTAGPTYCSSTAGFSAGAGYDQVTGLGSLDVYALANAWPANTGTSGTPLIGTTTLISAANTQPALNASDNFTITVSSDTGTTTPTGTVSLDIDGGTANGGTTIPGLVLTGNGTYIYSASFATVGTHQIIAIYSGDATHATSTGIVSVTVPSTSSGTGSFSLQATSVTVAEGAAGVSTITVTPSSGYTGTVDLNFDTSNDTALENLCYEFTNTSSNGYGVVTVSGTSAVTTQFTLDTNAADCAEAEFQSGGKRPLRALHPLKTTNRNGGSTFPAAMAFAGLFLAAGLLGGTSRELRPLACVLVLVAASVAVSSCGGGSSSDTIADPPPGTYTITVTGQDSATPTITASTQFTFTIQ